MVIGAQQPKNNSKTNVHQSSYDVDCLKRKTKRYFKMISLFLVRETPVYLLSILPESLRTHPNSE